MNRAAARMVVWGPIGFLILLTSLFIILKFSGYISWPWLWVLSPLWLPWACIFAIVGIILLVLLIIIEFKSWNIQ